MLAISWFGAIGGKTRRYNSHARRFDPEEVGNTRWVIKTNTRVYVTISCRFAAGAASESDDTARVANDLMISFLRLIQSQPSKVPEIERSAKYAARR